jgi:hypothetical protein
MEGEGNDGALRKYQLQMVKVFAAIFSTSLLTSFFINIDRTTVWLITVAYLFVLSKSVLHPIVESYMTYEIRQNSSKKVFHHMKRITRITNSLKARSRGEHLPHT